MSTSSTTVTIESLMTQAGWLRRLAGGLLRDPDEAEDAAQEALVAAIRRPPDDRGDVRAWFGRVLLNRARGRARSEERRRRTSLRAAAEPPAVARTPEEIVGDLELQRKVAELLLALEAGQREVLFLRYFQDLDSRAIGERLGIPAGTVRWRLKSALEELRRRLDGQERGDERKWRSVLGALLLPRRRMTSRWSLTDAALVAATVTLAGGAVLLVQHRGHRPAAVGAAMASPPGGGPSAESPPPRRPPALLGALLAAADPRPDGFVVGRLAPFTGVRWRGDIPEVEVGGVWSGLQSIDRVPTARIVAFAKDHYASRPDLWRKRIAEDLVDVLTAMGNPPHRVVALGLESLASGAVSTVRAEMTRENRLQVLRRNIESAGPRPDAGAPTLVDRFTRLSPFWSLRFRGGDIEIRLPGDEHWYRLQSMGGVTTQRLVAISKQTFGDEWRKRIAEDPIEVMTALGIRRPDLKVDLQLVDLTTGATAHRKDVESTEDNRRHVRAIWEDASTQ
jgi:RNA polymerase sigma factor (sigma-70 family)